MRAVILRTNDKPPSKPILDDSWRKNLAARLRPFEDPFTLHPWGKPEGPPRGRGEAVDRAFKQSSHAGTGFVLAVLNKNDKGVLIRVADVVVPASATDANEKVDRWFIGLRDEFSPGLLNYGCTVCKWIGNTGTPSQHNPWTELSAAVAKAQGFTSAEVSDFGNAGDMAHSSGQRVMTQMWEWSLENKDDLEIQNLIHWPLGSSYPLIWNPENGVHRYVVPSGGSTHDNHVHADFRPGRPFATSTKAC